MEPKNDKLKNLKRKLNEDYQHNEQTHNICNFFSYNYCQGRPKEYKTPKSKNSNIIKKQFIPKSQKKYVNIKIANTVRDYYNI